MRALGFVVPDVRPARCCCGEPQMAHNMEIEIASRVNMCLRKTCSCTHDRTHSIVRAQPAILHFVYVSHEPTLKSRGVRDMDATTYLWLQSNKFSNPVAIGSHVVVWIGVARPIAIYKYGTTASIVNTFHYRCTCHRDSS